MSGKQLKVPGLSAQRRAERRARMKRLTSYTPKPQRDWRGRIVTRAQENARRLRQIASGMLKVG